MFPFDRIRSYSWYALRIKAITWRRIDELIREIIDRIPVPPDLPFHHIFLVSCFRFTKGPESKIHFILDKILNEFFLYNIYKLDSCKLFCKIVPKKQVASHIRGRILVKINGDFCDFIFSRNHTFAINIYNRLQNYFSIFFIPKKQIAFIYRSICMYRWKFL